MGEGKTKQGLTSLEKKWVLYDVANSAFTLMVSTLISIFFSDLFTNNESMIAKFGDAVDAQSVAYWNYAATICTVVVVFLGPVFGTIADRHRKKKQLFILTVVVGALCTLLLGTQRAGSITLFCSRSRRSGIRSAWSSMIPC